MAQGYSENCADLKTYWDRDARECVPCPTKPGYEVTRNCGFDDNGGRHDIPHTKCQVNTFNSGSSAVCQPCTLCPPEHKVISKCTSTTDTQCQFLRTQTTEVPFTSRSVMMSKGYSEKCVDLKTYWDGGKCVPCPTEPGHEVTPNCGYDDNGGRHMTPHTKCQVNTFNSGSSAVCQPCTLCPPEHKVISKCTSTTDTQCQFLRTQKTEVPVTSNQGSTLTPTAATPKIIFSPTSSTSRLPWAVPLAIFISIMLVLSACMIFKKRKRGQHRVFRYSKRSSLTKEGFSPLSTPAGNHDLEHILSPVILSAPLQTVLDNLDVLEELVILLDPESHGVKNTKHLASHCSFRSTWITYTYSMKDSKSPLKAVLEGVTSRHPDWTVGHLAELLRSIERNDAVAVLSKLKLNSVTM